MHHRTFQPVVLIMAVMLTLQLSGCPLPVQWPIAKKVYTTAEQQVLPVAVPPDAPQINPADLPQYAQYGYSAWAAGPGTNYGLDPDNPQPYDKRTDLAPGYTDAPNAARLLSFFTMSDIHLTDKESPAQRLYTGWSEIYGPSSAGMQGSYSPIILSTTQVLDAAVQTINALHKELPFDFGISLGDDVNNTQYNELRWFIDVLDGKVITPSSGAHDGACDIDYQKPYKAAGLDREIPWYQTLGNHDQFWAGGYYESVKTMQAHIGNTILNRSGPSDPAGEDVDGYGEYTGVVDGTTPYGDVIKGGPEENFPIPPTVVADANRRTLATFESSTLNWMSEFFNTTSKPAGHGFTQANLDNDSACYSFAPKANLPLKIIVLDDTAKGPGLKRPGYARAALDQARLDWLQGELQEGQDNNKLMIIAAHIPIHPQETLDPNSGNYPLFSSASVIDDLSLLKILHTYPNLILWISGHRHINVITPQAYDSTVAGQGPENSFWEVETASLRDFPQQFRTFDIRRNGDNTISIFATDVDPAVREGSPAAKSRGYAIGISRILGATPESIADTASQAYNAELVKQLTPEMQAVIARCGTPIE